MSTHLVTVYGPTAADSVAALISGPVPRAVQPTQSHRLPLEPAVRAIARKGRIKM